MGPVRKSDVHWIHHNSVDVQKHEGQRMMIVICEGLRNTISAVDLSQWWNNSWELQSISLQKPDQRHKSLVLDQYIYTPSHCIHQGKLGHPGRNRWWTWDTILTIELWGQACGTTWQQTSSKCSGRSLGRCWVQSSNNSITNMPWPHGDTAWLCSYFPKNSTMAEYKNSDTTWQWPSARGIQFTKNS